MSGRQNREIPTFNRPDPGVISWLRQMITGGGPWRAAPIDGLSVAQVCDLLANDRRRWVLLVVNEAGTVELRQLSEVIASLEHGPRYTKEARKAAYVSLLQSHLPVLTEYGVLEEVRDHEYAPGPAFDGVTGTLVEIEYRVASGNREVISDG